MLERYTRPEMAKIWSLHNQYQSWLEVEIAVDEAWAQLGVVPQADVDKINAKATFNEDRIAEIEAVTHHDVVAFTRDVSESLGEERKWIHYGMTSTDVVDTAQGYRLKQANELLRQDLLHLKEVVRKQALKYKNTVMIGRTHGVQAEPTTFGLKLARWYSEINRDIDRFNEAANEVEAGKISGAVGTFANVPPYVEKYVCDKLGIRHRKLPAKCCHVICMPITLLPWR